MMPEPYYGITMHAEAEWCVDVDVRHQGDGVFATQGAVPVASFNGDAFRHKDGRAQHTLGTAPAPLRQRRSHGGPRMGPPAAAARPPARRTATAAREVLGRQRPAHESQRKPAATAHGRYDGWAGGGGGGGGGDDLEASTTAPRRGAPARPPRRRRSRPAGRSACCSAVETDSIFRLKIVDLLHFTSNSNATSTPSSHGVTTHLS